MKPLCFGASFTQRGVPPMDPTFWPSRRYPQSSFKSPAGAEPSPAPAPSSFSSQEGARPCSPLLQAQPHNLRNIRDQSGRRAQGRSKLGGGIRLRTDPLGASLLPCLSTALSSGTYPSHPNGPREPARVWSDAVRKIMLSLRI